ncbi:MULTISPECIES: AAA family ATPase [Pseudoalteromonas]|uniref:AAA family ATPase n=1 Tax=Pseudoalteromonas arctica TaxID=394751 RepID=A0ABU9TGR8_9GAMM|nr:MULTISPECIES: AAA family ATPase [unclassified Pseudoalteromonas]MBG9990092.1 SPOR domain-containing protein [Pseudoalteromonas sp. NZS37]MBH0015193.1 SPOR domain-containing protein [Pseudoalteromonas sp. NGC95]MBH0044757.1 SPOR domain-containing protein [Pseudoalteromonas sp. NZS11_1]PLT23416.1 cell division protein DamX [Pseudoalteromonas sp. MelDa3]
MQSQILPSRAALVDRIALQFEYGQNLIVLLGTSGLGKSYMLETFITDKYNDFNKAFVQVSAQMTDAQLMSELLEQSFNSPLIDHNLSLPENYYQLLQQQPCGPCLWVLDGGRQLSDEMLIELELLSKNSPNTLYIIIASQSKLALNNAVEIYLEPLTLRESKMLLQWYFTDLPYDEDPVFSTFLAEAHGNPSLLLAWQPSEHIADIIVKDKVSWRLHLLILMLLIMLLIIGLLYKSDMTQWWQQYYQQEETQVVNTAISIEQVSEPAIKKNDSIINLNELEVVEPDIKAERVHINDVPAIMQSLTEPGNTVNVLDNDVDDSTNNKSSVSSDVKSEALKVNTAEQTQISQDNIWYMQQIDTNSVIQLLAVTQQEVSDNFIAQFNLQQQTHTYQTKRNNKIWWVVTFGSFESINEAKSAMDTLSAEVRKNKPFYKKISKIKQEIALVDQ